MLCVIINVNGHVVFIVNKKNMLTMCLILGVRKLLQQILHAIDII